MATTKHIHTIPVDASMTPKEAWLELCIFGRRLTYTGSESWFEVKCDGVECENIQEWEEL